MISPTVPKAAPLDAAALADPDCADPLALAPALLDAPPDREAEVAEPVALADPLADPLAEVEPPEVPDNEYPSFCQDALLETAKFETALLR